MTIRQAIVRTLIILAASLLVVLAILPLAETAFAENLRSGFGEEREGFERGEFEGRLERERPVDFDGAVNFLAFIKVAFLMGMPALITLGILWINRTIYSWRARPKSPTPV